MNKVYSHSDINNTINKTGDTRVFTINDRNNVVAGTLDGRIKGDTFIVDLMATTEGERSLTYRQARDLGKQLKGELPAGVKYAAGWRIGGSRNEARGGKPSWARVELSKLSIPALAAFFGYTLIGEDDEGDESPGI